MPAKNEPEKIVPLVWGLNWDFRSGEGIPCANDYFLWKCPSCQSFQEYHEPNIEDQEDGARRLVVCIKCLKAAIMEVYDYPRVHDTPIPYDEPQWSDLKEHFEVVEYLPISALQTAKSGEWDGIGTLDIWFPKLRTEEYVIRLRRDDGYKEGTFLIVEGTQKRTDGEYTLFKAWAQEGAEKEGESINAIRLDGMCGTCSYNDVLQVIVNYSVYNPKKGKEEFRKKTFQYNGRSFLPQH